MKSGKAEGKVFYGVVITACMWLAYFLCATEVIYGASIVSTNVVLAKGWSEGVIGTVSSVFHVGLMAASFPCTVLAKKIGAKKTMLTGIGMLMVTHLGLMFSMNNPILYIAWFFLGGLGTVTAAAVTAASVINAWFARNKAMPMAIFLTSGSIGGFIVPLIVRKMVAIAPMYAWLTMLIMCAAGMVIVAVFVKDTPEEIGEVKDGRAWVAKHPVGEHDGRVDVSMQPSMQACMRSRPFFQMGFQLFTQRCCNVGLTSYVVLYAVKNGSTEASAAVLITYYAIAGLAGRLIIASLDRIPIRRQFVNGFFLGCMALGSFGLYFAHSYGAMTAAVMCAGLGFGASTAFFPLLISDFFGAKNFASLNGIFNTIGMIGGLTAPILIYHIAQAAGDYRYAFLAVGFIVLASAILGVITRVTFVSDKTATQS